MEERKEDLEIKKLQLEVKLKQLELELKKKGEGKNIFQNPVLLTILAGLIGVISSIITTHEKNVADTKLENDKFQYSLIQKAAESGDSAKSTQYLKFLLQTGYLRDDKGKIAELINTGKAPVITYYIDSLHPYINENGTKLLPLKRRFASN